MTGFPSGPLRERLLAVAALCDDGECDRRVAALLREAAAQQTVLRGAVAAALRWLDGAGYLYTPVALELAAALADTSYDRD